MARLAAGHPAFANAHRVLGSGGVVVRGPGAEAEARRARARLESEGVVFRGAAADPAFRVTWLELRGRLLEAAGEPASPGAEPDVEPDRASGYRPTA